MDNELKNRLIHLANKYETADFLPSDPSWFMHQVNGEENQETLAFIAASLSYGNRKQFFPKIQYLLDQSNGNTYEWVKNSEYVSVIPQNDSCYYRLYTNNTMIAFLNATRKLINEYGTIGKFIEYTACGNGLKAVEAITSYYSIEGIGTIIPKNTSSACKRVCMFLRWMVRDGSPVDLGLWQDLIDKRTLIMPLDTHVVQEAFRMGLLSSKSASMSTARKLTLSMMEVFPDDPLKGDFALFGLGIDENKQQTNTK